jgi:hypothetical protein
MLIITSYITRTALVVLIVSALLICLCPAVLEAQTAISAGDTVKKKVKGLDDPDFVGKWDFQNPGNFEEWNPLQAAGGFEVREGLVAVTANSQRPCLDLNGPYSADDISSIEIRIRGMKVERATATNSGSAMGGSHERMRILPSLYLGTRLYFTNTAKEKYDAEKSIEISLPLDGKFHVLTINPQDHASWKGLLEKIRLDIGDFPNRYELDYVYFHRKEAAGKKGDSRGDKSASRIGAASVESKK